MDMVFFRQHRRLIARFASLAMVLNFAAPAISHAMAEKSGSTSILLEICSAAGNKSVLVTELDLEKRSDSQDSNQAPMQHCPYCLTHAESFAVMHALQPVIALPDLSYSLPELFYHAPRPLFAWAATQPRAPPHSS